MTRKHRKQRVFFVFYTWTTSWWFCKSTNINRICITARRGENRGTNCSCEGFTSQSLACPRYLPYATISNRKQRPKVFYWFQCYHYVIQCCVFCAAPLFWLFCSADSFLKLCAASAVNNFLMSNFGEFRGSHVAWSQNEPSGSIKAKEQKSDETSYVWCTCKLAAMRENSWGNVPSPNLRVKPLHKYGHRRSMRNFNIFSMLLHASPCFLCWDRALGLLWIHGGDPSSSLHSSRVLSSPVESCHSWAAEAVAHWIIDEAQRPRGCVLTHLMQHLM